MLCFRRLWLVVVVLMLSTAGVWAQPSLVEHTPTGNVPSSGLSNVQGAGFTGVSTQRQPATPREEESIRLFFRVSFQNTYDRVCVYYTTDGSNPTGAFGTPSGTTQVLINSAGTVSFVANESSGGTRDWWVATLPTATRAFGQTIKYRVSAWKPFAGSEVFASGGFAFSYTNKLAWPGAGNTTNVVGDQPNGYPNLWFWKEEAVVGNGYMNMQLDRNGNFFDIYFPGAGGVYGVGTKNEGYVDGLDTFPAGLPLDCRGQMHINQVQVGFRYAGLTHWLSNKYGTSFTNLSQRYVPDTNTVETISTLQLPFGGVRVLQYDYSPKGVTYPNDTSGQPARGWAVKRMILINQSATTQQINVYTYCDSALNGGDIYDGSFMDTARNVMVHYDNTFRFATGNGLGGTEYKLLSGSGNLEKNDSVYLGFAMKTGTANVTQAGPGAPWVGAGLTGGDASRDNWRDTSGDSGQGWIGQKVTLPPFTPVEVSILTVTGYDNFAGATGTYNAKMAPVVDAFYVGNAKDWQENTNSYWQDWLASGVTVTTPDASINELFNRGLLGTALHVDAPSGSVIAGFHNGAYPYVWPRDAVYAAVCFARTGHLSESRGVYDWMKNTAYRDFEGWGRKGFWYQKYSTDGYKIWDAPQIDETAVFPWGVYYHYMVEGDSAVLTSYVEQVRDSVLSCSQTSTVDSGRLKLAFGLMYSNNVWEDSYDTFIYSNANVVRGLQDAGRIFDRLGLSAERNDANARASSIKSALDARLDWNGENTDISQLGISYPFEVYSPVDARTQRVVDRMNGTANDAFGNNHPLVNFSGEFQGLVNRYWGDGYWNGGPWFLSTLWYGCYYAQRQDYNPGKADIDNHYYRINRTKAFNGPIGFGAEQMSPSNSLLYPGQSDFRLQTAWPNAWESMSTYVDSVMLFLDYTPDAPGNTLRIEPKMPTAWSSMIFRNLRVGSHLIDFHGTETEVRWQHSFTNRTGAAVNFDTVIRIPANTTPCYVLIDGVAVTPVSVDLATGRIRVTGTLQTGAGAVTNVVVLLGGPADIAYGDGEPLPPYGVPGGFNPGTDGGDFDCFFNYYFASEPDNAVCDIAYGDGEPLPPFGLPGGFNPGVDGGDFDCFFNYYFQSCQ